MREEDLNSNSREPKIVRKGKWLYGGTAYLPVQIFAIDYDYYYEIAKADDQLKEGEQPELNENGEQYMIGWYEGPFSTFGSREYGGLTLDEAITAAEDKVQQKIIWDDPS